MIKIERITATKPTLLRNEVRQPVTLNMIVTADELASITANGGSIIYTVDELEVKTLDFQPAEPIPAPTPKAVTRPTIKQPQPKIVQPVVEPTSKENAPE
jgi:hypothetical protein